MTFTASAIKERLVYITGIQHLFDTINPDQLDIPQFIWDYDKQVSYMFSSSYEIQCSPIGYSVIVALTGLPIGYGVIVALTGLPIGYNVIVALTGLPIGYSVIVALTGLPIGYSVIVALTGLPIGYSVIVALTGLPIGYRIQCNTLLMLISSLLG